MGSTEPALRPSALELVDRFFQTDPVLAVPVLSPGGQRRWRWPCSSGESDSRVSLMLSRVSLMK